MAPINTVQPRYLLGLYQSSNTKFIFWNQHFFVCLNYVLLLFNVWMGGTIILGTLRNANKYCICSFSIMGLLWKNNKRWTHIEQVFFPFHHNTFTYCQIESFPLCTYKHSLNTSWFIFKMYIFNLICNELIMKIVQSSFIHR
jgi:peptidoglycan biosynthesis protein MviN/MurJ (putative lipid II flippase)